MPDPTDHRHPPSPTALPVESPPRAPADLNGRLLLHVKDTGSSPLADVSARTGGVVFSGARAAARFKEFAQGRTFDGPLLIDPSRYEKETATPDEPFGLFDQDALDGRDDLEVALDAQREAGPSMVLTPTRYLAAGDLPSLEAAADRVSRLHRCDDVALTVPLDSGWLRPEHARRMIAVLRRVPLPKALVLCDRTDPLDRKGAAQALRTIVRAVPDVALLRTDLAGIDALVHGARFASIGDRASVRHGPVPDTGHFRPNTTQAPDVLVEELLAFVKGDRLAERLSERAPRCRCEPCSEWSAHSPGAEPGRPLNTFPDPYDRADANAHNMAVWSGLWAWLGFRTAPADRPRLWQQHCARASNSYGYFDALARSSGSAFAPPLALTYWATNRS